MSTSAPVLDCIVIGYNDPDFLTFAEKQKTMQVRSGAYHEIKTNSMIRNGKRISCMNYLNNILEQSTGESSRLNVFEAPSLGVCYLTNFLKQRSYHVEFVNFFNFGRERLKDLLSTGPRSVAITTTFYIEDDPVIEIVEFVRQHCPQTKIIVGGPHIFNRAADFDTDMLGYIFGKIGADIYIIDSQGELTLSKVVEALHTGEPSRLQSVPNLMYTLDGRNFHRTDRKVEANDLDEGCVRWSNFDAKVVTPLAYLRTARSCPFTCSFCQYPILAGSHDLNSIEVMARQLEELREMGTTDLVFIDDTFNVPLPRFKKLLQMMIERKFDFRWVSFLRCSNVDEVAIDLMKESGCVGALLGIESGDQQILKYMNKAVKLERYRFGIRELNKRGIATYASLICGFPGETEQSVRNTIAFVEETGPTFFNVQLYYHDARAPIHKRAEEFKIEGGGYSWAHRTMDWREAIDWSIYMYKNIHNSIFFSLYGMSLWGISYLVSKGVSMEQIKAFGKATRPLLFDSLADRHVDRSAEEKWLVDMFRARGNELQDDPVRAFDAAFWQGELAGSSGTLALTAGDRPGGWMQTSAQDQEIVFDRELARQLASLAIANDTTVSTLLLAVYKLLLFQVSKQSDICIGLVVADKILPIRTLVSASMEFQDLFEAVIRSADAALDHQHCPPDASPNVLYGYEREAAVNENRGDGRHPDGRQPEMRLSVLEQQDRLVLRLEIAASAAAENSADRYLHSLLSYSQAVAFGDAAAKSNAAVG
jgi:radical SAM PhpK family P-methyltransferase